MKKFTYTPVLTIAGFDGSGGAGIQADIKTFSSLGCYATSVLTALPVQNTQGVRKIYPIPLEAVEDQIAAVLDDIFPLAIKIGMVPTAQLAEAIAGTLRKYPKIPIVFDPVMVATSGHRLIEEETVSALVEKLFPIAAIVTPNMEEAAILAQMEVMSLDGMRAAGAKIAQLGCKNVLLKGGHQKTASITSLLFREDGKVIPYTSEKFDSDNTHGSGCTLSSAIAAYFARGLDLESAVRAAQEYVFEAIRNGTDAVTGKGNGPLNHFFNPLKLIKNEMV